MKKTICILMLLCGLCLVGCGGDEASFSEEQALQAVQDALAAQHVGKYEVAAGFYTKALRAEDLNDEDKAKIYSNRGACYYQVGDYDKALEDFERVIKLRPEDVVALYNRAAVRLENGDEGGALEDYNRALTLRPDWAEAYYQRGRLYAAQDMKKQAYQDFRKAKTLNPKIKIPPPYNEVIDNGQTEEAPAGEQ